MQLMFYTAAAEGLSAVQGDIEELSLAAEGEYRFVSPQLSIPVQWLITLV